MEVGSMLKVIMLSAALLVLLVVTAGVSVAESSVDLPGFISIKGGQSHILALGDDGTVWGWGLNSEGRIGIEQNDVIVTQPARVEGVSNVTAIDSFFSDSMALRDDGTVWVWGESSRYFKNDSVGLQVPVQVPGISGVRQVVCGQWYGIALRDDGTVWAWGSNDHGQLGDGTQVSAHYYTTPVQVPGLSEVRLIATNGGTIFAVKADGVWAWGATHEAMTGWSGMGKKVYTSTPIQVVSLPGIVSCAVNNEQLYMVTENGEVWVKDGTSNGSLIPSRVFGLQDILLVNAGISHVVALGRDGSVYAWGENDHGQIGDGTTTDRQTPYKVDVPPAKTVFAGYYQTFIIDENDDLWGWGRDEIGELGAGKSQARTLPVKASFNGDAITPIETATTSTVTSQPQTNTVTGQPASGPGFGANIIVVLGCLSITAILISRYAGGKR
ncbi:RCC1 domain-containing protein [Methanocella conradii]|uniref:RCC1 domain-containing protein n=1 Tax=Methanocella conradii TaxID=1175444 RepID=UPI0024B37A52|nr:chromosome condensation regulator RCC1 [Methanocella conradii]